MRERARTRVRFLLALIAVAALATAAGLSIHHYLRVPTRTYATVPVRAVPLEKIVRVVGDISGAKQTMVSCDLEDLPDPDGRFHGERGLLLLEIVDHGARVKKGDVLARFDGSRYDELARRHEIELERARSQERNAQLTLGAAKVALNAYREGESNQYAESLEARIALARSDLERARERLAWSQRMSRLGYVSNDQMAQEKAAFEKLTVDQRRSETELANLKTYTIPRWTRQLEIAIENAETELRFSSEEREAEETMLKKVREMRAKCDLKAPHDGLVLFVDVAFAWNATSSQSQIRPGIRIQRGQELFYLPDLDHPVVELTVHEADSGLIHAGQKARIRVPSLGGQVIQGSVKKIDMIPSEQWKAYTEFKGVLAVIALDDPPAGLLPWYTAQVEIITGTTDRSLVLPTEAVLIESGRAVCFVEGERGRIERREVTIARADVDLVEVTKGLEEGDRVVADASQFRDHSEPTLLEVRQREPRAGVTVAARAPGGGAS
jgi:multidrug resistance efflux pump